MMKNLTIITAVNARIYSFAFAFDQTPNPEISTAGFTPRTKSATAFPVPGASVIPQGP